MEINWIESKSRSERSDAEVSVRKTTASGVVKTAVYFRNHADKKITHTQYLMCGITPNRIYFKEAEPNTGGYKVGTNGKSSKTMRVTISANLVKFYGDYTLEYDSIRNMYFIEKKGD